MMTLLLAIIYLTFISLGLPDSLLGSAWPGIYQDFSVPISYAGTVSMIIAAGTVLSSLESDRLIKWLGVGKVTLFSVAMTMAALFGFSMSRSFSMLCLWAIPYGLGHDKAAWLDRRLPLRCPDPGCPLQDLFSSGFFPFICFCLYF